MIPVLVERRQLLAANGLFTFTQNAAFALGFALLGPLVVNLAGPEALILTVAGLYLVASVFTIILPSVPGTKSGLAARDAVHGGQQAVATVLSELREGFGYIRAHRNISWSLVYLGVTASLIGVLGVLGPAFATDALGLAPKDFVVVVLPLGMGIVTGILLLNSYGKYFPRRRVMEGGLVGLGVLLTALSAAGPITRFLQRAESHQPGRHRPGMVSLLAVVVGIGFLAGIAYALVAIPAQVGLQEELPEEVRGRVFGVLNMLVSVASFVPIIIVGPLSDSFGTTVVLVVVGLAVTLTGVISVVAHRPHRGRIRRSRCLTGRRPPGGWCPSGSSGAGSPAAPRPGPSAALVGWSPSPRRSRAATSCRWPSRVAGRRSRPGRRRSIRTRPAARSPSSSRRATEAGVVGALVRDIAAQDHRAADGSPLFDLVVIDDRSDDGTGSRRARGGERRRDRADHHGRAARRAGPARRQGRRADRRPARGLSRRRDRRARRRRARRPDVPASPGLVRRRGGRCGHRPAAGDRRRGRLAGRCPGGRADPRRGDPARPLGARRLLRVPWQRDRRPARPARLGRGVAGGGADRGPRPVEPARRPGRRPGGLGDRRRGLGGAGPQRRGAVAAAAALGRRRSAPGPRAWPVGPPQPAPRLGTRAPTSRRTPVSLRSLRSSSARSVAGSLRPAPGTWRSSSSARTWPSAASSAWDGLRWETDAGGGPIPSAANAPGGRSVSGLFDAIWLGAIPGAMWRLGDPAG